MRWSMPDAHLDRGAKRLVFLPRETFRPSVSCRGSRDGSQEQAGGSTSTAPSAMSGASTSGGDVVEIRAIGSRSQSARAAPCEGIAVPVLPRHARSAPGTSGSGASGGGQGPGKRRRWYLGIQSKKEAAHVMTEVWDPVTCAGAAVT